MEVSLSRIGARAWTDFVPGEVARLPRAEAAVPRRDFEPARQPAMPGEAYARLRARLDEVNALAHTIRREGLHGELRKLYPPYPPGQEASLDELERLPGLRKQIEALRYPAAPQAEAASGRGATTAEFIAGDIGEASRRQLARLDWHQAISMNRQILEGLAWEPTDQ